MANPASYKPTSIPDSPGVYRFFDEGDVVLYVGKALSLKSRLGSYFHNNLPEKTERMVRAAVRVDWTVVNTEVEALQLEYSWIKQEKPRFNVQFKDDKSYPFLGISLAEEFPRLIISRGKKQKGAIYFGPFAHAWALRSSYDILLKIFPVRSCSNGNFERAKRSKRQCLLGDIGKCAAPCVEWVTQGEHKKIAENLAKFMEKGPGVLFSSLEKEMERASSKEEFERAGRIRDQLNALTKAHESTDASLSESISADFIAIHEDLTHAAVTLFIVRHGRITGSRSWIVDLHEVPESEGIVDAALHTIYSEFEPPHEIYISDPPQSGELLALWLKREKNVAVEFQIPQRGEKAELIATVKRNANQALIQFLSKRSNDAGVSGRALEEIAIELDLAELPLRIECFDISNIQGTSMVASMVVFEDGQSKKSEYRRFSIDDEAGFDDTRAMHHVITRRFKRYLAEKDLDINEINLQGGSRPKFAYPPNLIVVDGGKGQVSAAVRALSELGINDIPICGLAKRLEEIWLPDAKTPVIFPRHSEALYLLQRIRDEAHRFAITFHRSKRSRLMLESLLDEIPLLGEVRINALLDNFGSVTAIKKASAAEIAKVPGIGEKIADLIFSYLDKSATQTFINMETGEMHDA